MQLCISLEIWIAVLRNQSILRFSNYCHHAKSTINTKINNKTKHCLTCLQSGLVEAHKTIQEIKFSPCTWKHFLF